jgi:OFA family oxalate/formate antiporter-like MFS transporter
MAVSELSLTKTLETPKWRYALVISCSLLVMICAGSAYAWSIFVAPLRAEYGFSTAATQLVYGCILAIFGLNLVFVHKIYNKLGPRKTAAIGAVFFSYGYLIASFSNGSLLILILGVSVVGGIGMALGYMTVLPNLVKWFPNNRGLATGMAVAGFGGGSVLMTQIASPLLNSGMPVLDIFRLVGIIYGILFLLGALFLTAPPVIPGAVGREESRVNYRRLLKDRRFWVLAYTSFAASFGGLMFYGNAKPLGISLGVSAGAALLAVILMSAGNAIGRATWGQIHDMIGSRKSILLSLVLVAGLLGAMLFGVHNDLSFVALVLVFGFCFGADQVLYASNVAAEWGVHKMNIIYPLVFLGYAFSAIVAPTIGGKIFDVTNSYTLAVIISIAICLTGIPVYALLMPRRK